MCAFLKGAGTNCLQVQELNSSSRVRRRDFRRGFERACTVSRLYVAREDAVDREAGVAWHGRDRSFGLDLAEQNGRPRSLTGNR